MYERFGRDWAFDYATEDDAGVDRFRLSEIDFDTGAVISTAATRETDRIIAGPETTT
jgi:hypothetical protein